MNTGCNTPPPKTECDGTQKKITEYEGIIENGKCKERELATRIETIGIFPSLNFNILPIFYLQIRKLINQTY